MLLLALLSCTPDPKGLEPSTTDDGGGSDGGGDQPTDGGTPGDGGGETTVPDWISLPSACEAPATLGAVGVRQLGEDQHTQTTPGGWFMELVDLEIAPGGATVYGAGQGGMMVFDVSEAGAPELVGVYPTAGSGPVGRYYHVEPGPSGLVYATHRDFGLDVLDVSTPSAPSRRSAWSYRSMEGLAYADPWLVAVGLDGTLRIFDTVVPESPALRGELGSGLGSAVDLVIRGTVDEDAVAYVASLSEGVVRVDLSRAGAPVLLGTIDVGGGVQDLAIGGDHLYVAAGGAGIVTVDISEALAPVVVDTIDLGGSVQSVSVDAASGLLWAVDQDDVLVFDLSTPGAPSPWGTVQTAEHAMHVAAGPGIAYVGDWSRFGVWQADKETRSPDIDLSVSALLVREEASTAELTVTNTGAATLSLLGATVGDGRFTIEASTDSLQPAESATVRLSFSGGDAVDTVLCLASDDPDTPTLEVSLWSAGEGEHSLFGVVAPDFSLQDLDGTTHVLSEQLGHPVVLAYFATW